MAYPQTADLLQIQIPLKGMNVRDPLLGMDPLYAPWIYDFDPEPQYVRARNGWRVHSVLSAVTTTARALLAHGEVGLFAYGEKTGENNKIWNVTNPDWKAGVAYAVGDRVVGRTAGQIYNCTTAITASDTEPTRTTPGTNNDDDGVWTWVSASVTATPTDDTAVKVRSYHFAKRSAFLTDTDAGDCAVTFDGSSWALWGFTYDPGTGAVPVNGPVCVNYKGRVYIFNGTNAYYSALAGVTGATTLVDLSTLFDGAGVVAWAKVLVDATNKPAEGMLAIGNSSGEILVYAGDNPAATNWEQIGHLTASPPLFYDSAINYNNDVWIATTSGMISLRKLMAAGTTGDSASVSSAIDPYWSTVVSETIDYNKGTSYDWSAYPTYCSVAYWPEKNKIYVLIRGKVSDSGSFTDYYSTIFIYNGFTGAWIPGSPTYCQYAVDLKYFKNNIYILTSRGSTIGQHVWKIGDGFMDESYLLAEPYAGYGPNAEIHSAYLPAEKWQQVVGFAPIINTDYQGADVDMRCVSDFGRKTSATSSNRLLTAGGLQAPFYSVGADGQHVQWRLWINPESTYTTGFELYSMGVAVK